MKKFIAMLAGIAAIPALSCSSVNVTFNRNLDSRSIKRVAIFPFAMEQRGSAAGNLDEAFTVEFLRMGCNPVDRSELKRLMKEQSLTQSGLIDSEQAVRIGQMAGARAIVIGSGTVQAFRQMDVLRKAFIKVIDVETTSIILAGTLQTGALLTLDEFAQDVTAHLEGNICQDG